MAIRLADTARPNNHIDAEHPGSFPVAYAEDIWFRDGTRLSEKTFSGDSIQKEELPLVSSAQLGKIYQYIGESGTYEHGCFYECVENDGDYEWKELPVVKNAVIYTDTEPIIGAYAEGSVIVYSGETVNGYKKGHHYKYVVDEPHTLNLFTGENATIQATTYLRVLEDELVVGAHTYNESGDNSGYIISVNEDTVEYYSYYYKQVMTVINIRQGTSSTINITDYVDIGGGNDEKAVGGIIDVETLPTSNIKNTFYRVAESNEYYAGDKTNQTTERMATYEDVPNIFVGTQAEWDILTVEQKKTYDQVNITDDDAADRYEILPYEFNHSSNVSAFNRKWLVTGNSIVWTATHTGRLTIRCLKHGDGYSLYLTNQNSVMLDSYDNFFGDETHGLIVSEASVTLQAWVKKGDVIELSTNLPANTDWANKYFVQTGLLLYNDNFD